MHTKLEIIANNPTTRSGLNALLRRVTHADKHTSSVCIGRSSNVASWCRAPIQLVDGARAPELVGQPHLKTQFSRGGFSKTLYSPSTMAIRVGREWWPKKPVNITTAERLLSLATAAAL